MDREQCNYFCLFKQRLLSFFTSGVPRTNMAFSGFKTKNEKSGVRNALLRILFSHLGLFILVALYAVAGAFIFMSLELPEEERKIIVQRDATDMINAGKKYIVARAWYETYPKTKESKFKSSMKENLNLFRKSIIRKTKEEYYDGTTDNWAYKWTVPNALLFTVTLIGAIGYGNVAPSTWIGQLFTIYYAMIGIPLLLLFLANIGELMANAMRYIYSRICCRWCRARRRLADYRDDRKLVKRRALMDDEIGLEPYMPTKQVQVPIMVNLAVIAAYLACGGVFFQYTEGWKLHQSCYFCFITLTTIGFGDYVPGTTINNGEATAALASVIFLVTIFYSIFGMALLSMSINLMKTQVVQNSKWCAQEIGLMEEDYDPKERYQIKVANEEYMIITPEGKDGNKNILLYTNTDEDFTLGNNAYIQ